MLQPAPSALPLRWSLRTPPRGRDDGTAHACRGSGAEEAMPCAHVAVPLPHSGSPTGRCGSAQSVRRVRIDRPGAFTRQHRPAALLAQPWRRRFDHGQTSILTDSPSPSLLRTPRQGSSTPTGRRLPSGPRRELQPSSVPKSARSANDLLSITFPGDGPLHGLARPPRRRLCPRPLESGGIGHGPDFPCSAGAR